MILPRPRPPTGCQTSGQQLQWLSKSDEWRGRKWG